jgi:hypothetical protein
LQGNSTASKNLILFALTWFIELAIMEDTKQIHVDALRPMSIARLPAEILDEVVLLLPVCDSNGLNPTSLKGFD